ncbi:MAG: bifunctional demethylmenaquinone methyltransferase/2-methoxy-6-polyprenyl-1,4-benzoquinol methylase UbiE [Alphaproteobacteria bacterium]|nr:bifunctional demethylmenaquinone methyltransferase/2-methoxy-6-polyprenyl-1,4-benzoquinol methylase UbiE [Alphaproteobacteria bacterium]
MKQNLNPESTWFGTRPVKAEDKADLVRNVFDSVANSYDIMNDVMSGGVHRLWKDRLIRMIRPRGGMHYLDVAGGTGDIAFRIRKAAGSSAHITICDINPEMLRVGRDRAANKGWLDDFEWVTGDAEKLPVPDNSVDVYTIAFGLRNVTRIDNALADAYRVLKPGGRFFCLEFSRVEDPSLRRVYDHYSDLLIPRMGQLIAKDRDSYQYLIESIRKFPHQRELARRMGHAGFSGVRCSNLSFGIAAIHQGYKT